MTGAELFGARRVAFGAYAATYDAVRPEWPSKTVAWMLGSPATATVCRTVDLGAGTGKGTRAIAALGHEVIAVEPSDGMRKTLAVTLGTLPGIVAARICVVAGDAECARVLRPGGWLSLGWHHRSEDVEWSRELTDIVERHEKQPDDEEAPPVGKEFEPFETEVFTYRMRQSIEDLVLHASTWSYVAIHPECARILDDVRALGRRVADTDGMVEIPWTTRCYRQRRR